MNEDPIGEEGVGPATGVQRDAIVPETDAAVVPEALAWLPEPVQEILGLGGPVVMLLLLLSTISLAIIVFKTVELFVLSRRRGIRRTERALALWEKGRDEEALSTLAEPPPGIAGLTAIALHGRHAGQPESLVREEVQRVASGYMEKLRSNLGVLDVIGSISPLLGLFGIVLGMIEAFRRMEAAGSQVDPSVLSGGIWQALLTTGVGLAVAIPTVLAHRWLERRAETQGHRIENAVTRVFTSELHRRSARETAEGAGEARRAA